MSSKKDRGKSDRDHARFRKARKKREASRSGPPSGPGETTPGGSTSLVADPPYSPVDPAWIKQEARFFNLTLTDEQCAQTHQYLKLLQKWNRKVNLTSIRSPEEAVRLHFLESFFAASQLFSGCKKLVDVGSGAGFPGLAMKIVRPDLRVVLLDSRKKKVLFQREVIFQLKLQHVTAFPLRLQEGGAFLEQADAVCWRALKIEGRDLAFLLDQTPASCVFICFQGEGERAERALAGCDLTRIPIPGSKARTLLLARKPKRAIKQ